MRDWVVKYVCFYVQHESFLLRTYQEEELITARTKSTLRSDMYQKMMKIDPTALSAEEHAQKGVTKCRYLQWRDTTSSTSMLGFRIEGIMVGVKASKIIAQIITYWPDLFNSLQVFKCAIFVLLCFFSVSQMEDGSVQRDFRKILTLAQVTEALLYFTRSQLDILVSSVRYENTSYITLLFL